MCRILHNIGKNIHASICFGTSNSPWNVAELSTFWIKPCFCQTNVNDLISSWSEYERGTRQQSVDSKIKQSVY